MLLKSNWQPVVVYQPYEIIIWGFIALLIVACLTVIVISIVLGIDLVSSGKKMFPNHKKELRTYLLSGVTVLLISTPIIFWQTTTFIDREHNNYVTLAQNVEKETKIVITEKEAETLFDKGKIIKGNKTLNLTKQNENVYVINVS